MNEETRSERAAYLMGATVAIMGLATIVILSAFGLYELARWMF